MSSDTARGDIRIAKTVKALNDAMFSLLEHHNFRNITVKNLCEEALTSRATFYTHFVDKYELLKYCLKSINLSKDDTYEQIEKTVNQFVYTNETVIKNLVYNADNETVGILFDAILSSLALTSEKDDNKNTNPRYIVLSNFYAGGIITYLSWHVNNKFPSHITLMNKYLFGIIKKLQELQPE